MRLGWTWAIVLTIASIIFVVGIYGARLIEHGLSARDQPISVEDLVAGRLRRAAIPARAKTLKNPMPTTAEMLMQGRNHWADHCATCHANNGSGETEIGRNLYPKAPDMRQPETQSLSDGELYYIIRNGVAGWLHCFYDQSPRRLVRQDRAGHQTRSAHLGRRSLRGILGRPRTGARLRADRR